MAASQVSGSITDVLHVCAGVGSLVGAWLAAQPGTQVCLLGRSGRPSADSAAFLPLLAAASSGTVLTMARCDVASQEEVASMLARSRTAAALQAVLHAGTICIPSYLHACHTSQVYQSKK